MAFLTDKKQSREMTATQVPTEGFSERYMGFLTQRCGATLCEDGIFRNKKGARYCSCDMCGQVSEADFGGEFCIFHMNHHGQPGEAGFFTQRLHHYRDCVVIAKTLRLMRTNEGSMEGLQLFYAACASAGIPIEYGSAKDPISVIEDTIAKEWETELARRLAGASKKKPKQADIMRQKLANLASNLRMNPPITPTFEG